MKPGAALFIALSTLTVTAGCGGGSGAGFHTSVPASKPLNTLSPSDVKALCMDMVTFLNMQIQADLKNKDLECRGAGLGFAALAANSPNATDAQLQQACQVGYQLCLSAPADAGVSSGNIDAGVSGDECTNTSTPPASCTATVAQYTACVSEASSSVQDVLPPCNELTKAKLAMLTGDAGAPGGGASTAGPACMAFQAACPGVNITTSSMMSPLRSSSP